MVKLSRSNNRVISNVCITSSQVFLASMIIPIFMGFDLSNLAVLLFGIALFVTMFLLALVFGEKGKI